VTVPHRADASVAGMSRLRLAIVCSVIAACGTPARPTAPAPDRASAFVAALAAKDFAGSAALFAADAEVSLVAGPTVHGRAAIASALDALSTRFVGLRVAIGRRWIRGNTHVIELAVTARSVGVAAAAILSFDREGLISVARIYVDVPTLVGQVAHERLPEGVQTRDGITGVLTGTAIVTATGSSIEAANLGTTGIIWARLDAHDPAGVLASAAPGYVYDDYSGPAALDVAGTRKLLDGFLGLVQDFTIVEKPTYFAAGNFVITESVEHMSFRGKPITLHGLDIKEFAGGRVTREWQYANGAEVLTALLGLTVEVPLDERTP
jgi:SnoaL-like domain